MIFVKRLLLIAVILAAISLGAVIYIDQYVQRTASKFILKYDTVPTAEAILVLGANVFSDGTVSLMLQDRLTGGYELFRRGIAPKILVSGDHGQKEYNEVRAMKNFLLAREVPAADIFLDHAGFSTYDSVYRAREIFQLKKFIIVTQAYHLPRAVFIARELGAEAYGVASDLHNYGEVMGFYRLREVAARNKDFLLTKLIKPQPRFLGEIISTTGDGTITDDE